MPLALGFLWRCPQAGPWSLLLSPVVSWLWVLCWAEAAPSPAQAPPVPGDWFKQPQSTENNTLGLVSICFFHCWPSSLESFVNSFVPSSLMRSFDLIALIPKFMENLWSALHSQNMEQWMEHSNFFPFFPILFLWHAHTGISVFGENFYLRHP